MKRNNTIKAGVLALSLLTIAGAAPSLLASEPTEAKMTEKAQDAKAIEIIERSIEKSGGRDLIASAKYVHQKGNISIPMAGITGTLESHLKVPDHFLLVINIPMIGEQRQGLNGEIAWSTDAMNGPRLLPEEESEALRQEADVTSRLRFKEEYPVIEYKGDVDFDGQKASKLRLVDEDDAERFEYYSVESGLLIGTEAKVPSAMGEVQTTSFMREYKEMGGVLQPTKIVQKVGPQEFEVTITETSYDKFEDSVFEMPAAVKSLVEASKKDD
jgi:hypothetical protein